MPNKKLDTDMLTEISKKMNVVIFLGLHNLQQDEDVTSRGKRKKGTGDLVKVLAGFDLKAEDIADIVGSPVQSVRTMLTPSRQRT